MKIYEKNKPHYTCRYQKAIKFKSLICISTCLSYKHLVAQIFVSPQGQMSKIMFMRICLCEFMRGVFRTLSNI